MEIISNISAANVSDVFASEDSAIRFLESVNLIPKKTDKIPCPMCSCPFSIEETSDCIIGFEWVCKNETADRVDYRTLDFVKRPCSYSADPLERTFFEEPIPFKYYIGIICYYVAGMHSKLIIKEMKEWCEKTGEEVIDRRTVKAIYKSCQKSCCIFAGNRGYQPKNLLEGEEMYRNNFLLNLDYYKDQIVQFVTDLKLLYPGYRKVGLLDFSDVCERFPFIYPRNKRY